MNEEKLMPEALIVFKEPPSQRTMADLKARYRVTALMPPRLAALDLQEGQLQELQRMAGVEAVLTGPENPLPASLTEQERLFIMGWLQRRQGGKQRKGEGLPWDAEGYLPPDKPPSR
jgi:hypothetical protein